MAREYLAMMLHLLLGGEPQVALGWPIKLRYADRENQYPTYAWISEGIEGESLGKIMRESPERLETGNIDRESFTQLFLLSFLTCPEDGQPENFKVIEKMVGHSYCDRLWSMFCSSGTTTKVFFGKHTQVLALKDNDLFV